MSSFVFIIKEQVKNIYLIKRLANFEIRIANTIKKRPEIRPLFYRIIF